MKTKPLTEYKFEGTMQEFFAAPGRWCQNSSLDIQGRSCLMGAVSRCYYPTGEPTLAVAKLQAVLRARGYDGDSSIVKYNDTTGRTITEIRALVEEANV